MIHILETARQVTACVFEIQARWADYIGLHLFVSELLRLTLGYKIKRGKITTEKETDG